MIHPPEETRFLFPITDEEFGLIRGLVHERLGINLTSTKRALVMGRLQQALKSGGYPDFRAYYQAVLSDTSGRELSDLADRISTNHTFFNREKGHFEFLLKRVLPPLVEERRRQNQRRLRIWCAASSTGEEPYMLAMLLREFLGPDYANWDAGLLATDISERALAVARAGVYEEEGMRNLPADLRGRYFRPRRDGRFEAVPNLASEITFRRFNLINPEYPFRAPFDVIFCRNVMIYFDGPTKEALVRNMHRFTQPGGWFFAGHTESLDRRTCPYEFILPGVYRKGPAHG